MTCPACFETIEVPAPSLDELPADVDYDCEVCCRPMRIRFHLDDAGGEAGVVAEAVGWNDL